MGNTESIPKQLSVQCASKYKRIISELRGKDKTKVLEDVRYDFIVNLDQMLEGWGYGKQFEDLYTSVEAPECSADIDTMRYEYEVEDKPKKKKETKALELDEDTKNILDKLAETEKPCTIEEECDKYRDSIQLPRTRKLRRIHAKNKEGDNR